MFFQKVTIKKVQAAQFKGGFGDAKKVLKWVADRHPESLHTFTYTHEVHLPNGTHFEEVMMIGLNDSENKYEFTNLFISPTDWVLWDPEKIMLTVMPDEVFVEAYEVAPAGV